MFAKTPAAHSHFGGLEKKRFMVRFETFHSLPQDAADIRKQVFIEEQGFTEEFDDVDAVATHLVLYDDGRPVATCRYFRDGERNERNAYVVGRLAVLKEFRGKSLGAAVLREAERQIKALNAETVLLSAQVQAKGFYEKQGYAATGTLFYEEDCPHIRMCKTLDA